MTGWRLGWMIVPQRFVAGVERLAQNIFLAAPTPAQHAALAAFKPQTLELLEARRAEFEQRRDYLLPALRQLGFDLPITPDGAFYLYAGCGQFTQNSQQFAANILEHAGVAITPGLDFGSFESNTHVRFAYTTSLENLEQGVARLAHYLRHGA
jgi:aspartate/methionine/tyrosine aminotransferase